MNESRVQQWSGLGCEANQIHEHRAAAPAESHAGLRRLISAFLVAVMGLFSLPACGGGQQTNSILPVLSLTLTERYDSNVMLQNVGAQANQESYVTSVLPVLGGRVEGQGDTTYSVGLAYTPDFTFFQNLSRETYLRQIGLFDFSVKHGDFTAHADVKAKYTDGTTEPPTWGTTANGDQVPALGACEVRNRRRNMYFSAKALGRQQLGQSFIRGVFDARIWDFMTDDSFVSGTVIQNYYDRSDINGGVDFGIKVHPKVEPFIGYRLGHQDQEFRANSPSYSYANNYQRIIFGLASQPMKTLRLSGEIGPSFHYFDASTIPAGTDTEQTYLYFLGNATYQLASNTTFSVAAGEHLLPASAGNGVFQNLTAAGTLDHRFSSHWRGSFRFAFTQYNFFADFLRDDQAFEPEASIEYTFNRNFSASAWYSYTWAQNVLDIPNGSKRNYDRQIVGLGIKATF